MEDLTKVAKNLLNFQFFHSNVFDFQYSVLKICFQLYSKRDGFSFYFVCIPEGKGNIRINEINYSLNQSSYF